MGLHFFFWLGHELGPIPKWGPAGADPGPEKKPGTLNRPGQGHGSCPAGRVRVWKNPAQTRPVVIPSAWFLVEPADPVQFLKPYLKENIPFERFAISQTSKKGLRNCS